MANQTRLKYHPRQQKEVNQMDFFRYRHVCTMVLLAALAGCAHQQNSQDLKEKTPKAKAADNGKAKREAQGIRGRRGRDKPADWNNAREQSWQRPAGRA